MNWITDLFNWISKLLQWWVIVMPWEKGLRVRYGKRVTLMNPGVWVKFPLIDSVYVQTTRLRYVSLPVQTVTTSDNHTITLLASAGYTIEDIEKLYTSLFQPEMTIANLVLGNIARYVANNPLASCKPSDIEKQTIVNLNHYGLGNVEIKVLGYAIVKTYRLIQDHNWLPEGYKL